MASESAGMSGCDGRLPRHLATAANRQPECRSRFWRDTEAIAQVRCGAQPVVSCVELLAGGREMARE